MKNKQLQIAMTFLALAIIGFVGAQQTMNNNAEISVNDARQQLEKDSMIVLLDVRTPKEYSDERIGNTPLIPLSELEQRMHELDNYKERTIIVYCRSGNRSSTAVTLLHEKGFNALNMMGGIRQWKTEKFPILSGPIQ